MFKRVMHIYNAQEANEDGVWCPVTQGYIPTVNSVAAHIVRHVLGEGTAAYIFGYPRTEG